MRWLCLFLSLCGYALSPDASAGEIKVVATVISPAPIGNQALTSDVKYWLEPLYPAKNNQARAKIDLLYSCVDAQSGGRIADCYITLNDPVARENSGGHYAGHSSDRPTGRHVPSAGYVDPSDGYLRATYYSSEVSGVVDVAVDCVAPFGGCSGSTVTFGIGYQGLTELGDGTGYVLTGAKTPHPSNHWGVPAFVSAAQSIASQFHSTYPDTPLQYNDMSLEYGGVFDVATAAGAGYDWTPPHKTHRQGTNMDVGIPRTNAARALLQRLCQASGISPYHEDTFHWHLIY